MGGTTSRSLRHGLRRATSLEGGYGRSGRELELLAGELGVSPEYLLGRTEKKTPGAPEKKARREIDGIYEALNGQGRRIVTGLFWQA